MNDILANLTECIICKTTKVIEGKGYLDECDEHREGTFTKC